MGKKRVQSRGTRQVRQVRQVRPKNVPAVPTPGDQRKQRERYVQSGGMLQGYAPELVERIARIAAAGALACVLVAALLLLLLPYGWFVRGVAAGVWLVPILIGVSFILPGYQLARKDRRAEPRVVQGQLLGASEVSTSLGLGTLMIKTRGGTEQYLVTPDRLSKVPGNQVTVVLTVTPNLRHVRSVGVVGQRLVGRPDQAVPKVIERLRLMPIVTPTALAAAGIIGVDAVAFVPVRPDWLHAVVSFLAGAALTGIVFGISHLLQRRLYDEMQSLLPGGVR
jgi:fatty acid desaturase